ncbi:MAG: hypothetical protein ACRC7S_17285 [Cetobacterium sp.]
MVIANFKNDKFVSMLQEFFIVPEQNTYAIGELDLTDVYFFVKNGSENYKVLSSGQYQVVGTNLIINDDFVLNNNKSIQVCRVLNIVARKYISDVVNINTLRTHYNTLVEDFTKIMDLVRKTCIRTDSNSYVFPDIVTGEYFLKSNDGFIGKKFSDFSTEVKPEMEELFKSLDEYTITKKIELDNYNRDFKKPELDQLVQIVLTQFIKDMENYIIAKKQELKEAGDAQIERINALGLESKMDKTGGTFTGSINVLGEIKATGNIGGYDDEL